MASLHATVPGGTNTESLRSCARFRWQGSATTHHHNGKAAAARSGKSIRTVGQQTGVLNLDAGRNFTNNPDNEMSGPIGL